MQSKEDVLTLLKQYLIQFPSEAEKVTPFNQFLYDYEGEKLYDRKNFKGHITASAFIINEAAQSLLLLKHKFLNRWLQPGGHVDFSDSSLMAAALREAYEETGISSKNLTPLSTIFFDADSHLIPANPKKQEPQHFHYDVRFLFRCSQQLINFSAEESTAGKWISFEELRDNEDFDWVDEKLKRFL